MVEVAEYEGVEHHAFVVRKIVCSFVPVNCRPAKFNSGFKR